LRCAREIVPGDHHADRAADFAVIGLNRTGNSLDNA
jgi:hypothetical protein